MNTTMTSNFRAEVEIWPFRACAIKICNMTLIYGRIYEICASWRKSGSTNTMVTSDLKAEVDIWRFRACAMHPVIIIGTVRSLWTWLWGRYHFPRNVVLVLVLSLTFYLDVLLLAELYSLSLFKHYLSVNSLRITSRHLNEYICRPRVPYTWLIGCISYHISFSPHI